MLVMCSWNPVYKHYRDAFTSHIPVFTTDITHVAVVLFVTDFFLLLPPHAIPRNPVDYPHIKKTVIVRLYYTWAYT